MFHTEFAKASPYNTFYDNPELDALLDEVRITVSTEECEVLWRSYDH